VPEVAQLRSVQNQGHIEGLETLAWALLIPAQLYQVGEVVPRGGGEEGEPGGERRLHYMLVRRPGDDGRANSELQAGISFPFSLPSVPAKPCLSGFILPHFFREK
jgi:hypothetical protein